jgi:hypothetical protein
MGKFEDMLTAVVKGMSPEVGNLSRLGGPVFNGKGVLRADFSPQAVRQMLSDPKAVEMLSKLPPDKRAALRTGLESENRLWADEFDKATSGGGSQRRLDDGGDTAKSPDDIEGLGAEEALPTEKKTPPNPRRVLGTEQMKTGGTDSKGKPRTAPVMRQGDAAYGVKPVGEKRKPFERVEPGMRSKKGPDGRVVRDESGSAVKEPQTLLQAAAGKSIPDRGMAHQLGVVIEELTRRNVINEDTGIEEQVRRVIDNPATGKPYTKDEILGLPKEEIDRLVSTVPDLHRKVFRKNKAGEMKPLSAFDEPQHVLDSASKSQEQRQMETAINAIGFNPSAPVGSGMNADALSDDIARISNSSLPALESARKSQPPEARSAHALASLRDTFGPHADSIAKALSEADGDQSLELAFKAANDIVNRNFPSTARMSPRSHRDAVHGVVEALMHGVGRPWNGVVPDSVLKGDIDAIRKTESLSGPIKSVGITSQIDTSGPTDVTNITNVKPMQDPSRLPLPPKPDGAAPVAPTPASKKAAKRTAQKKPAATPVAETAAPEASPAGDIEIPAETPPAPQRKTPGPAPSTPASTPSAPAGAGADSFQGVSKALWQKHWDTQGWSNSPPMGAKSFDDWWGRVTGKAPATPAATPAPAAATPAEAPPPAAATPAATPAEPKPTKPVANPVNTEGPADVTNVTGKGRKPRGKASKAKKSAGDLILPGARGMEEVDVPLEADEILPPGGGKQAPDVIDAEFEVTSGAPGSSPGLGIGHRPIGPGVPVGPVKGGPSPGAATPNAPGKANAPAAPNAPATPNAPKAPDSWSNLHTRYPGRTAVGVGAVAGAGLLLGGLYGDKKKEEPKEFTLDDGLAPPPAPGGGGDGGVQPGAHAAHDWGALDAAGRAELLDRIQRAMLNKKNNAGQMGFSNNGYWGE